jgi:hypothetical protein
MTANRITVTAIPVRETETTQATSSGILSLYSHGVYKMIMNHKIEIQ